MSRFEEASELHRAVRTLRLRAQTRLPQLSDEQHAKRLVMIETFCALLEKSRDEAVDLGIHEWGQRE